MSNRATRQARKHAEADLRDARRDLQHARFGWARAQDPVSRSTFARAVVTARAREAEAESRLANLRG